MINLRQNSRASVILATIYSIGLIQLGIEIGQIIHSEEPFHPQRQLRGVERKAIDCGGHPKKLYGHIHIAKTGGTSLNNDLAETFERVCGHKAYSFDAGQNPKGKMTMPDVMDAIGYEDCDYISHEMYSSWWIEKSEAGAFHYVDMELHVPCRDPIEHLMSMCHHDFGEYEPRFLECDAKTDEEYFDSVKNCFVEMNRYEYDLTEHFSVKCFDFEQSFTGYIEYLKNFLEERRIVPDQYLNLKSSHTPRNKDDECIWGRPDLLEKTRKYLIEQNPYYGFCDKCMGTNNELPLTNNDVSYS
mmetsp:Transcript_25269/g.53384  ORF Transcript_25269/g.53384 Transcript_25269/m.53384 type:complete len:300 (+) Transcript_25269:136-1035(+)